MSEVGMWTKGGAGLADHVFAGVAVISDWDTWMEDAEMGHVVTIELL